MAFPTAVNSQITDSVTQANVKVLGDAPAIAMGNLYQATAQALANAAHNATNAQQQSYVTAQAATTMGVATLYSLDTASTGVATKDILGAGSGLRIVADIWIYLRKVGYPKDHAYVEHELEELGMTEFERDVRELGEALFGSG